LRDPELAGLFVESAQESLDGFSRGLSQLAQTPPGTGAAHTVFRFVHNLKGSAACAGLPGLSALAREVERLIEPMRRSPKPVPTQFLTTMANAAKRMQECVDRIRDGRIEDVEPHALHEQFTACRQAISCPSCE
jgi:two-component system chemotaxis sensor kinase CheA